MKASMHQLKLTSEQHKEIGASMQPAMCYIITPTAVQAEKVLALRAQITFASIDCQTDPIRLYFLSLLIRTITVPSRS
jgi:hypothetical protein